MEKEQEMNKPVGSATKPKRRWLKWVGIVVVILLALSAMEHFGLVPEKPEAQISALGQKQTNCQRTFTPKYSKGPYYNGPLFDDHFHLPFSPGMRSFFVKMPTLGVGKDVTINEILCNLDREKSGGALTFYMPKSTNKVTIPQAKEIKNYTDKIKLFVSPAIIKPKDLEKILKENPDLFAGIGEIGFYEFTNKWRPINGRWAKEIYKIADAYNLPVMIHPGRGQQEQVENILSSYANVTFLLHGHESAQYINQLMGKYPNVYYSVDGASLYSMRGAMVRSGYVNYVAYFKNEFASLLDEGISFWRDKIGTYPDRFTLGTDRGGAGHYSEEFSQMTEEFSRAFIGALDKSVQEKFAHQNAEKFLHSN